MITRKNTKTLTGAQIIVESLKSFGTDTVFGYPGGMVLPLYDELSRQTDIKHILVRHEQSAVHAAEGYARVSGKCGVVLVTSGPGATNTVTGIVNAYLDGYPLIILTGQVNSNLIGKDAFQEANICDITKSCTKMTFQITSASDIQKTLYKAYKIAMSGKKGPVVVDLAKNIFSEVSKYIDSYESQSMVTTSPSLDLSKIVKEISNSNRPLIIAGGGVNHSGAYKELSDFVMKTDIPFVSTMMGLGAFDAKDSHYIGMLGIFGDNSANEVAQKADLIISLGARLNDRITCKLGNSISKDKIIQVDVNQDEIGRVYSPKCSVVADIKWFLSALNKEITNINRYTNWLKVAQLYKNDNVEPEKISNLRHCFEVIRALDNCTQDKNVIFTSEVGQHQLFAVKNLTINQNRKILLSGGSGTMGFGLPAAIGACIANKDKTVVCITGDGSIQMDLGELILCREYNLDLKIIILNNGYLGMVRQLQQKGYESRYYQTKISNPDFNKIAQAYGIDYIQVKTSDNIEAIYKRVFSKRGPHIIEVDVEPMEVL